MRRLSVLIAEGLPVNIRVPPAPTARDILNAVIAVGCKQGFFGLAIRGLPVSMDAPFDFVPDGPIAFVCECGAVRNAEVARDFTLPLANSVTVNGFMAAVDTNRNIKFHVRLNPGSPVRCCDLKNAICVDLTAFDDAELPDGTFCGCSSLQVVVGSPRIRRIGMSCFRCCNRLRKCDFSGVQEIGESAFECEVAPSGGDAPNPDVYFR
jgi:hypothetical protein